MQKKSINSNKKNKINFLSLSQNGKGKQNVFIFVVLLQALLYGIGNPFIKISYETITPLWSLSLRFILSLIIISVIIGKKAIIELRSVRVSEWMPGAVCMAGSYIFSTIALNMTSVTLVGFLMSLPILFVPILALIILRRRYRLIFIPIQLAAAAGLYLLCSNEGVFSFGWGEALALLSSVAAAGALVLTEKSLQTLSPLSSTFAQVSTIVVLSTICSIVFENNTDFLAVSAKTWWLILFLAIFCSGLCYILQNVALDRLPASVVSLALCSEPIFTAVASYIFLGEKLSKMGWGGSVILMICIIIGNYFCDEKNSE